MDALKKYGLVLIFSVSSIIALLFWLLSGSLRDWIHDQFSTVTECTSGALETKITDEFTYICDIQSSAPVSEITLMAFLAISGVAMLSAAAFISLAVRKKWRR